MTPELVLEKRDGRTPSAEVKILNIVWKGLRCTLAVDGDYSGASAEIRTQPGNPSSTVVASAKPLKENGTASVVVEDEDLEGTSAYLVILDQDGKLLSQTPVVIGGGNG